MQRGTELFWRIANALLAAPPTKADGLPPKYETAIALPAEKPSEAVKAALERAHELRKFEIENYWKRATYFWAFQFTAFTIAGWGASKASELSPLFFLIPCTLGVISGWVAWLSSLGSKFWQENWESHVDALEGLIEGRLTQVVLYRNRSAPSVSRVNEGFLILLTFSWLFGALAVCAFSQTGNQEFLALAEQVKWSLPVLILAACGGIAGWAWPRLKGEAVDLNTKAGSSRQGKPKRRGRMLVRDTIHGPAKRLPRGVDQAY